MLLGYNTNGFTSHRFEDGLRIIGELGYRSVGITLDHHVLDPYAPQLDARIASCRALLDELELVPVIETGARFLLDPWNKHRPTMLDDEQPARARRVDFLQRATDIAAELGAPVVSLWSGAAPEGIDADTAMTRLVECLGAVCEHAAHRGVVVGFEPEPGMYIETMAQFDELSAAVDHPAFQLTLDIGHAHITEEDGPIDVVLRFRDRIVNVHVEGMNRARHDHLPPWEGDMDVRAVVSALEAVGYAGPATLELSRSSHAAVDTARRAYEFLTA
jgi:sugar phosphate isomerase/epimerase